MNKRDIGTICRASVIVVVGVVFARFALAEGLYESVSQCSTKLWNGTTQTVPCDTPCGDKDYNGQLCGIGHGPTMSCRRICNTSHQVTGVECICVCDFTQIDEPNCSPPAN